MSKPYTLGQGGRLMAKRADIEIVWDSVTTAHDDEEPDEAWDQCRCLYAYLAPRAPHEILYVGKAWGTSVRQRWSAKDKLKGFWKDLEKRRKIFKHATVIGTVLLKSAAFQSLTRQLLADIESLLIAAEQPWGNIMNTGSRGISRPGMIVRCSGDWPSATKIYIDEEEAAY